MARIDDVAMAAVARDALATRSLVQDLLRDEPVVTAWPAPDSQEHLVRAVAAALAELLATRAGQEPPPWTSAIGALPEPLYLLRAAETLQRLRSLCETDAPPPLRRRLIFAPANYLETA